MKIRFLPRSAVERRLFVLSAALVIVSLALVAQTAQKKAQKPGDEFYRFVYVAEEVHNRILNDYVDEISSKELLEGAIRGMFLVLDEHSSYLDSDSIAQLEKDTEGEFSGVGIHITLRQGLLTVIAPIPGSPAARQGVQPWDRIIEIEGKSTENITLQEAVRKLTGPVGTQVTFKVFRPGEPEPLVFTVTRQVIKIDSVHSAMLEDRIGYVRLAKFSDSTSPDMRRALLELKEKGMKGLILDLRFNSGGLLREAIEVSEFFVPKDAVIVSTKGRREGQDREFLSKKSPLVDCPVFVLVNQGTASASEIVAGAIQDLHLGVVIGPEIEGEKINTFGKGSVQTISELERSINVDEQGNPLPNAIRLTTAKYYTPSGRSIHGTGIKPDIFIPVTKEFQGELLMHGMIGDPSYIEPGHEGEAEPVEPLEKETAPSATPSPEAAPVEPETPGDPAATPTPDPQFYLKRLPKATPEQTKAKEKKEPFHDVMLEQAQREMKVHLLLQEATRRRLEAQKPVVAAPILPGARNAEGELPPSR